jgi:hypothetical protein
MTPPPRREVQPPLFDDLPLQITFYPEGEAPTTVTYAAAPSCRRCADTGFVAYWDGSALAGEGCPDCTGGPEPAPPAE